MSAVEEESDKEDSLDTSNAPLIYTSDDERDVLALIRKRPESTTADEVGKSPPPPPLAPDDAVIPLKKPKLATSSSLVSYAIDEDEEEELDESESTSQPASNLVQYEVEGDSTLNISSTQAHSEFTVAGETLTIPSSEQLSVKPEVTDEKSPSTVELSDGPNKISGSGNERDQIARLLQSVQLPPEPSGHCPMALQDKVDREIRRMQFEIDYDPNRAIQDNKFFRNPSIYKKLISFMNIDEKGTNFSEDVYDPYRWSSQSYYDELHKVQTREIERLMKLQKEQKKAEATKEAQKTGASQSGAPKVVSVVTGYVEPKKRSKWDAESAEATKSDQTAESAATKPVPIVAEAPTK